MIGYYLFYVYVILTIAAVVVAISEAITRNRTDVIDVCLVLFGGCLIGAFNNWVPFLWKFSMLYGIVWAP